MMADVRALRIVGVVGKVLIAAGVLILLFVVFQLWGTGLHEARAQDELQGQLDAMLAAAPPTTVSSSSGSSDPKHPTTTVAPKVAAEADIAPDIGEPVGRIEIPKVHVNKITVQGVSLEQLDRAPGHYPQTPFPGQAGNASFAGHRTTYGAPFFHVDRLKAGDKIFFTTVQGRFTYLVQKVFIVEPDDVWVLKTATDHPNTLTLTACHPKTDLTKRIIVRAVLAGKPVPHLPGQDEAMRNYKPSSLADGVTAASHPGALTAAIIWGALCAAIWFGTWWISRWWRRRGAPPANWVRTVVPYVVGVPLFGLTLFVFFENLAQILPAGI
jgi:sortase A